MKYLLVPVDFSDVTDRVVATAEQLARAMCAKMCLLHCVNEYPQFYAGGEMAPVMMSTPGMKIERSFPEQEHQLAALVAASRNRGVDVESKLIEGSAADEIVEFAERLEADMVVMGSHGHGALYELMVGTVTQRVLHHIHRPVLVVPTAPFEKAKSIPAEAWSEPMAMV